MACHYELNPLGTSPSIGHADLPLANPANERLWFDAIPHRQAGDGSGSRYEAFPVENEGTEKYRQGRYQLKVAINASSGPWYPELLSTGPVPVWLVPEGWAAFEAVHFCKLLYGYLRLPTKAYEMRNPVFSLKFTDIFDLPRVEI